MGNVTCYSRNEENMVMAKKAGEKTKEIAEFLGVSRKTVWKHS